MGKLKHIWVCHDCLTVFWWSVVKPRSKKARTVSCPCNFTQVTNTLPGETIWSENDIIGLVKIYAPGDFGSMQLTVEGMQSLPLIDYDEAAGDWSGNDDSIF